MLVTVQLCAHGDLDLQITGITEKIRHSPRDATLYLHRAELHRQHGEPASALADIAEARRLDPKLADVDFAEGRALLDLKRGIEARSAFDRFLKERPDHPIALWHRAQALIQVGQRAAADADLKRCIDVAPQPTPELFMARATNLEKSGELEKALAGLAEGLQRLGGIRSLQLAAVELEVKLHRPEAAVARLDSLIAGAVRKAALLLRKGGILAQGGQVTAARDCYLAARRELESLPPTTRKAGNNRAQAEEIENALTTLEAPPNAP